MRRIGFILLLIMVLQACEEVPEVSFRVSPEGFNFENSSSVHENRVAPFEHRISGGVISFSGTEGTFRFDLRVINLEDFLFTLPQGEYQLEFSRATASLYGQELGTFLAEPRLVRIDENTDTLFVQVEANCSLFLVEDPLEQLEQGAYMIKRYSFSDGHYFSYPMPKDAPTGLYYTYFTPDPMLSDPSAFLWFYEGRPDSAGSKEGGLSTCGFEIGYQYYIRILD